jgi:hypothetical protein
MKMEARSPKDAPHWKLGGYAALYLALAYLVAMPYFLLVSDYQRATTPASKVAAIVAEYPGLYAMYVVTYVLFGIVFGTLALSLHDRLRRGGELWARVATAVGLMWSGALVLSGMVFNFGMGTVRSLAASDPPKAGQVWQTIEPIADALGGGGGETLGGLWMLLVGWIAIRARILPRALAGLGAAVGFVGVASIVPALRSGAYVFGLLQIVWFSWLGLVLLGARRMRDQRESVSRRPSRERGNTRAALLVLVLCMVAGSVASAADVPGTPCKFDKRPTRFIRVEGLAVGGLFETRDARGAISGRLASVTYVCDRARVGFTYLDGFGRPKSMSEGNSIVEMLYPIHVGFNLMSGSEPRWRVCGMPAEVYAEAVVGFWNQADAHYKYHPNTRLALCTGVASHGVGVRAELGFMSGRDALYAGLQVRMLTFDLGL